MIFYVKYGVKMVLKLKEDFYNHLMEYFEEADLLCNHLSTTYNRKNHNILFVTLDVGGVTQTDIC